MEEIIAKGELEYTVFTLPTDREVALGDDIHADDKVEVAWQLPDFERLDDNASPDISRQGYRQQAPATDLTAQTVHAASVRQYWQTQVVGCHFQYA